MGIRPFDAIGALTKVLAQCVPICGPMFCVFHRAESRARKLSSKVTRSRETRKPFFTKTNVATVANGQSHRILDLEVGNRQRLEITKSNDARANIGHGPALPIFADAIGIRHHSASRVSGQVRDAETVLGSVSLGRHDLRRRRPPAVEPHDAARVERKRGRGKLDESVEITRVPTAPKDELVRDDLPIETLIATKVGTKGMLIEIR